MDGWMDGWNALHEIPASDIHRSIQKVAGSIAVLLVVVVVVVVVAL
jgi:hypothetical protein